MQFKFQIYPAWFGGPEQADLACAELATHMAEHYQREVLDIRVNRTDPKRWFGTVEFV